MLANALVNVVLFGLIGAFSKTWFRMAAYCAMLTLFILVLYFLWVVLLGPRLLGWLLLDDSLVAVLTKLPGDAIWKIMLVLEAMRLLLGLTVAGTVFGLRRFIRRRKESARQEGA